jgi:hypothetical protein
MLIVGMVTWWYGAGWRRQFATLQEHIAGVIDYFSIDLLFRTLFAPFRQISAGKVNGPIGVKLRAFFDRLISRIIGAVVRIIMIVIGSVTIILYGIIGSFMVTAWAVVPLVPCIGIILFVSGWIPWK